MIKFKFKFKCQSKEDKVIIKSSAWAFYSVTSDNNPRTQSERLHGITNFEAVNLG